MRPQFVTDILHFPPIGGAHFNLMIIQREKKKIYRSTLTSGDYCPQPGESLRIILNALYFTISTSENK